MSKYKVLDIFAGAGGLSLGFEQTGKFKVVAAIESCDSAKNTFKANHKDSTLYENVLNVDFSMLNDKHGPFNVIIGGPPCQGFSNANRQHNQLINMNNKLIRTYVDFICNLQPQAFLLENVKMLESDTHRFFLTKNDNIEVTEYPSCSSESLLIYEGTYSFPFSSYFDDNNNIVIETHISDSITLTNIRKLKRIIAKPPANKLSKSFHMLLNDIKAYLDRLQNPTISQNLNFLIAQCENELKDSLNTQFANFKILIEVVEAIIKLEDIKTNKVLIDQLIIDENSVSILVKSFTVKDYLHHQLGKKYIFDSQILNAADYGVPQNRQRFIMVGILKTLHISISIPKATIRNKRYNTVKDAIEDLKFLQPNYSTIDEAMFFNASHNDTHKKNNLACLRDSNIINNHIITKTSPLALERFSKIKPGKNFHSLDSSMVENYSNPSRTQNSIYLRLDENMPCPTVTNVRKAMWIHPTINRAISVREAARLQSFPESFIFMGTKDQQYQQVGNAVPPLLAKELAKSIGLCLDKAFGLADSTAKTASSGKK